jgi:hypothetical protein
MDCGLLARPTSRREVVGQGLTNEARAMRGVGGDELKALFAALSGQSAEFTVVGAHAVMVHTEPRFTKDLDVWVRPSPENALHVHQALEASALPSQTSPTKTWTN